METLPPELIRCILDHLEGRDLVRVACLSYKYYLAALTHLFSELVFYVDPYSAELTPRSAQLLVQLYSDRDVRGVCLPRTELVRAMTILPCPGPCFKVTPRAFRTLYVAFFQLIRVDSIQRHLQRFCWHMGSPESTERFPFLFPGHLRVLDCYACQVDADVVFPSLKALTVRRMRATDGAWLFRQIRESKLESLSLAGCDDTEMIRTSSFVRSGEQQLESLRCLQLEHLHADVWPLPNTALLEQLAFRFCGEDGDLYASCANNVSCLDAFTLVSGHDVWDSTGLKELLLSCHELKELTLLLGGRTTNIPLDEICSMRSSLRVLILEARLFSIAPALHYQYSLDEVHWLAVRMPDLQVLGLSVDMSGDRVSQVSASSVVIYVLR